MRKKILSILLCSITLLGLTGCGNDTSTSKMNELSGLWYGDSNHKTFKIYFDCDGNYDLSYSVTSAVSSKTAYYGYSGKYEINGDNITLYTDNKQTGETMVADKFHFFDEKKTTICGDTGCYDKDSGNYTCEFLSEKTN